MRHVVLAVGLKLGASFALLVPLVVPAQASPSPIGVWLTEDGGAKVELRKCGQGGQLCSKIVWLKDPNDERGRPLKDGRNKNASLRQRPILGLEILTGLVPAGERIWSGQIYNPEDGNTYRAKLTLVSPNQIKLQGCAMLGLICGEKIWTRSQAEMPQPIKKPAAPERPSGETEARATEPAPAPAAAPPEAAPQPAADPAVPDLEPQLDVPASEQAELADREQTEDVAAGAPPDVQAEAVIPLPEPSPLPDPAQPDTRLTEGVAEEAIETVTPMPPPEMAATGSLQTSLAQLPPAPGLSLGAAPPPPMPGAEHSVIATLPGMLLAPPPSGAPTRAGDAAPTAEEPRQGPEPLAATDPATGPADPVAATEPGATEPAAAAEPPPATDQAEPATSEAPQPDQAATPAEPVPLPEQKPRKAAAAPDSGAARPAPRQASTAPSDERSGPGWQPTPLPWQR